MSEKKIRYLLDSGIDAIITPLSAFTIKALRDRAVELHPLPDPTEDRYKAEMPEGVIGSVRGEETIEWQNDQRIAVQAQSEWLTFAVIDLAVDFGDRPSLVTRFAPERQALAQYIALPDDDWQATLRHCLLKNPSEPARLFSMAAGQIALSEDEVADGVRFFRPQIQG